MDQENIDQTKSRIDQTKSMLNALAARIHDTKKKSDPGYIYDPKDIENWASHLLDLTSDFMNLQVQISAAYETWSNVGLVELSSEPEEDLLPALLAQILNDVIALMCRLNHDVGKSFLDLVVGQAQIANSPVVDVPDVESPNNSGAI